MIQDISSNMGAVRAAVVFIRQRYMGVSSLGVPLRKGGVVYGLQLSHPTLVLDFHASCLFSCSRFLEGNWSHRLTFSHGEPFLMTLGWWWWCAIFVSWPSKDTSFLFVVGLSICSPWIRNVSVFSGLPTVASEEDTQWPHSERLFRWVLRSKSLW